MKKFLIIWLIIPTTLFAQNNIKESVFSHLSSKELLVGESLYFKNYVFSEHTGKLSSLSRILYVEILNASGSPVYQTKLLIKHGQSEGEYFVPSELETGHYHFVAYTRWMKNFDQFYHQSITIINPYISQKFPSAPTREMEVNLSVEGGALLANAKNKVVFRVTDQYGQGFKTKGRVISSVSEESFEVNTDEYGLCGFYLTPESHESYQLILEEDDGFKFFDLPKPCTDCTLFRVIQTADLLVVKTKSNDEDDLTQGYVDIFKNLKKVYSSPMVLNTTFSIPKNSLPKGLLNMVYTDAEGIKKERLFWNGELRSNQSSSLGVHKTESDVTVNFAIQKKAELSISVEQIVEQVDDTDFYWYAEIGNKIDQKIQGSFFESTTEIELDHLLIGAKYFPSKKLQSKVKFLPELRSGLVQGKLTDEKGNPEAEIPIGLAFAGSDRQLCAAMTDSLGQFVLTYDPLYTKGEPMIKVLSEKENIIISIEPEFYPSYPAFESAPVVFDSARVASVIERSIHNQIMNAYYIQKDPKELKDHRPQFQGVKTYKLDSYTRFATMRDTFIELIVEVGVSKNEERHSFKMRSQNPINGFYQELPTLLLLDGAFVSAEELMNLSPYLVDRIDIINHKYYFGKIIFDGIISVHTTAEDMANLDFSGQKLDLIQVESHQTPNSIQLSNELESKIPAFQDLLHWQPYLQHQGGSLEVNFSTSLVKGMFEVRLEGVTEDGTIISQGAFFRVN